MDRIATISPLACDAGRSRMQRSSFVTPLVARNPCRDPTVGDRRLGGRRDAGDRRRHLPVEEAPRTIGSHNHRRASERTPYRGLDARAEGVAVPRVTSLEPVVEPFLALGR